MYAIIRTGGKQYKVQAGDLVRVEKLSKDLGSEFDVTDVLVMGADGKTLIGEPVVKNAKVTVVVTKQSKTPRVIVFKKKRRQGYRRMHGHRQMFTELFIKEIVGPEGLKVKADSAAPVYDPEKRAARLKAREEARQEAKQAARSGDTEAATKRAAPKGTKKVAKKAAGKKTAKKASGKKKTAKKAGKKAKKKTSK